VQQDPLKKTYEIDPKTGKNRPVENPPGEAREQIVQSDMQRTAFELLDEQGVLPSDSTAQAIAPHR
jgi:hypothetical protein